MTVAVVETIPAHERISTEIAKALTLLNGAERQFRLHNTDQAVRLLIQAEARFTSANEALPQVLNAHRFEAQQRVNNAINKIEAFRSRMSEV